MPPLPVGFTNAQDHVTSAAHGPADQRAKQTARKSARTVGSKVGQEVGSKVDQVLGRDRCAAGNYAAPEPPTAPHILVLDAAYSGDNQGPHGNAGGGESQESCHFRSFFPHLSWIARIVGEHFFGIEGMGMRKNGKPQRLSNLAMGMVQFLLLAAPVTAQIPCSYDVQIIASPLDCGLGTVNTYGLGLNEHGDVVGYYKCPLWDHTEAFLWTAKQGFVTLQRPQGVSSAIAVDIHDEGIICGTLWVSGLGYRGFVYDNGEWTILPPVVDIPGAWSGANAINNAGTVVGQRSTTRNLNPQNAYIWSAEEGFTNLGVMNGPNSSATDINGNGDVCGWTGNGGSISEAFLWKDGKLILLGIIPGGFTSTARGVNSVGAVSGSGRLQNGPDGPVSVLGFVWDNRVFSLIDPIIGYDTSSSGDINDQGYATGTSVNLDQPTDRHGFVWLNGVTHDLNDFIDPKLPLLLGSASGIANSGQIVANGHDDAGETLSFLLTPRNSPLGDLDGDCIVGVADLLILLAEWGQRDSGKIRCQDDLFESLRGRPRGWSRPLPRMLHGGRPAEALAAGAAPPDPRKRPAHMNRPLLPAPSPAPGTFPRGRGGFFSRRGG